MQAKTLAELVDAAEIEGRHHASAQALRSLLVLGRAHQQLVEREHRGVGRHPDRFYGCRADGSGMLRRADETVWRDDLDRGERTFVPLHVPGECRQDRTAYRAGKPRACAIDEAGCLPARAGKVELQLVAELRRLAVELVERIRVTIVLEKIDAVVLSIGQLDQSRTHLLLGRRDHSRDRLLQSSLSVAPHKIAHT